MVSTITPFTDMSKANELWFKEPVKIYIKDEYEPKEVCGIATCYLRDLKANESIDTIDEVKEYDDFVGGTILPDVYEVVTFPDGKLGYVEVEVGDYSDYESVGDFEFVTDPFEDGVMV